jgi:predicted unusual protein kinase regulating ubiquinone biosynthesis (AarF/ABC1/UbiB family)
VKKSIAIKPLTWQRNGYFPLRLVEISTVSFKFLFLLFWDNLWGKNTSKSKHERAQWLVNNLIKLGPTFIKIGQSLSTRPDLLPLEYIQELSLLQDKVPPFSSQEAIATIEQEFNTYLSQIYQTFEHLPIASASLGQVHKATLFTGENVVVKVQRPGLQALFKLDFVVLTYLVNFANFFIPNVRKYELHSLYREFFQILYQEIDYIQEGKNADRFRENFKTYSGVIAPSIYWEYTTQKVLTMEYLPGIKIDDRLTLEANNIDTNKILKLGICSYLKQLLQDGFFQSDPHPGNMAVTLKGEIIFYDFGTMTEVQSMAKDQMIRTFFAVLKKDTDEVVETLTYMGLITPMSDMTPVRRLVAFLLEKFRDKPVDIKEFDQISGELYQMFEQQPFRLPPQMTFIIKSVTTLDGIARSLDPQYNLLATAQPFIKSLAFSSNGKGNILKTITKQTKDFIQYQLEKPSKNELLIRDLEAKITTGELQFRVKSVEGDRTLKTIHLAIKCLINTCISGFSLIAGILFLIADYPNWAIAFFCFATFWFYLLIKNLIKLNVKEKLDQLAR